MAVRVKLKSKRVTARRQRTRKPAKPTLARRASDFVRIHFWTILGLLMMTVLVHDLFGARGFLTMRRQQLEVKKLEQDIQSIKEENNGKAGEIERLKTDPEYIERLARENHGLARPGERVFKIPPKETATPVAETAKQ